MDCSIAELLVKSIWFAGPQYEDAIAKSEERIAGAHTGLKVEVNIIIIVIIYTIFMMITVAL